MRRERCRIIWNFSSFGRHVDVFLNRNTWSCCGQYVCVLNLLSMWAEQWRAIAGKALSNYFQDPRGVTKCILAVSSVPLLAKLGPARKVNHLVWGDSQGRRGNGSDGLSPHALLEFVKVCLWNRTAKSLARRQQQTKTLEAPQLSHRSQGRIHLWRNLGCCLSSRKFEGAIQLPIPSTSLLSHLLL